MMNEFSQLLLATLLVAICCPASAAKYPHDPNMSLEKMIELHYEQIGKRRGSRYEPKLVKEHNKHWKDIVGECQDDALEAEILEFYLMIVVGADGNVIETLSVPQAPELACFIEGVSAIRYPAPPYETWYELALVQLTE